MHGWAGGTHWFLLPLLSALVGWSLPGCGGNTTPESSPLHYTRNEVELFAGLEPDARVIDVLAFDTPVTVVETHRSFSRVRLPSSVEGWLPGSMLLDEVTRAALSRLTGQVSEFPSQGIFRSRDTLNVHTEPQRWAPTFYQLDKDESFSVLDRMTVDRLPSSAANSTAEFESIYEDYWYLVRVPGIGAAGWLLANMAYVDLPIEVAALAGGREIVAFFRIDDTEDESVSESKPTWLWFQSYDRAQLHDFDSLSVVRWDRRRDRYTIYRRISGLTGYLPVQVLRGFQTARGFGTGFRFLLHRGGQLHERTVGYAGRRFLDLGDTRLRGAWPLTPPGGFGRPYERRAVRAN